MSTNDPINEEHADGIVEDRKQSPPIYFNILFYGLIIWGVVFMAWFLFSGWSSHEEFAEKMAAHTGTQQVETSSPNKIAAVATTAGIDSAALYAEKCAGCHGAKGEGAFGPDLTAGSFKYGRDQAAVRISIANGRPKSMPAFEGKLSADQIDALTSFVLEL